MSKNGQNKFHYEIGVVRDGKIIEEYVTDLSIIEMDNIINERFARFIRSLHGNDVVILWNRKEGDLPDDKRPRINIEIPEKTNLKYYK